DREHVTPYLRRHTPPARTGVYHLARDLSGHRLCVDTAEDFALVERVLTALAPVGDRFTLNDVIACLADHLDWRALNAEVPQATGPFRR
ncbi:MAG: spore coat protein, partial [Pseudomonadota bacterium]|nr:spore coat protein [Pseudomonadota bacterium]